IDGPGACGITYPLRVSALGASSALGYDDESLRPPGAIPNGSAPNSTMPQSWPGQNSSQTYSNQGYGQTYGQENGAPTTPANRSRVIQSSTLPPPQQNGPQYNPYQQSPYQQSPQSYPAQSYPAQPYPAQQPYSSQSYPQNTRAPQTSAQAGVPLSLNPSGLPEPDDDEDIGIPGGPPHPYYRGSNAAPYSTRPPQAPLPPLGPPDRAMTASIQPVAVEPAATLACPIVSALDQWITGAVQPAALRWFRQPVVEIKQISAYSCRGMNGDPNAHISEHAFGNALDVAEFDLADGHKISVQYGWHGSPEEQGFLHDVQSAACDEFTTVLAPGANVYHYNHIHVDLMRHYNGRHICEPTAIPGEVAAARVRSQYAAHHTGEHYGDPGVTGSIKEKEKHERPLSYSSEDDDRLPLAVPGED
ncbi:MAG TPA: extensin family protein, partial [Xanthobacteraceae bacterium]|nr:extensin family protein [Xanthobacteraceae bacterium]